MFRESIRVDEESDILIVLRDFSNKIRDSELSSITKDELIHRVTELLNDILPRAQTLAKSGSQLTITREFRGDDYLVVIELNGGKRKSLLSRFKRYFERS